jgi:GT2 family glycosyltransferase
MINNNTLEYTYVLIPVHNRKETTLRCLAELQTQKVLEKFKVVVIDDGSTDNTSVEIQMYYPEVNLLSGDGSLWWTGAIRKGMEFAYQNDAKYFIWMNDDTLPSPGSLLHMLEKVSQSEKIIVSGQCYKDMEFQYPTYGGQKKGLLSITLFHTPIGQILPCDCMSGNLVCFPRSVIDEIGLPPADKLPHNMADIVYTWEAKKAGFDLLVCGDATATCEFNPFEEGWSSSPIGMMERWKRITSYKSNLYPTAYWYYCYKFYGVIAPIAFIQAYLTLIIFTILRLFFPLSFLVRLKKIKERFVKSDSINKVTREL